MLAPNSTAAKDIKALLKDENLSQLRQYYNQMKKIDPTFNEK